MDMNARQYAIAILATAVPLALAGLVYVATRGADDGADAPVAEAALSAPEVIDARCAACHQPLDGGGHYRLNTIRKTPEGWDMTLTRMTIWHRVQFSDDERRVMVKYFADRQGLAPEEAAPYRFALEQDYNRVEAIADDDVGVFCARCHSYARVALQRRDEDEWRKLAHTHLGQYPSMEHQEKARNEEHYWAVMRDKIPVRLDVLYPLDTAAWSRWVAAPKASAEGSWRIAGEWPGAGRYTGTAVITATGDDEYSAAYTILTSAGTETGEGTAIVYTGYEWRGSSRFGSEDLREVFALSEDGDRLTGRWYLAAADELGASFEAVRVTAGGAGIVAVEPPYLRAGAEAEISIHGYGLAGEVSLGDGVEIVSTVSRDANTVTVLARASTDTGGREVTVGETAAAGLFAIYEAIDSVRVEPPLAIARVGAGGGPIRKVGAQFNAIAYINGADGEPGTDDDIRLGSVPATWSVANYDDIAEADHDTEFAGSIDERGLFTPGDAGVNPARAAYSRATNNVGNLAVIATVMDGQRAVTGRGHLIVTVQRWVRPSIR